MTRTDWTALLLSLVAFVAAVFVSTSIYQRMPHIEDEVSFVWQAQAMQRGVLTVPTPQPNPNSFLIAFVVDYHGQRFGKYPLGWPALLAVGGWLNARDLVNPFLTGLAIWLIYRLGQKVTDAATGLLAALLALTSPFLWMNAGSLLSHPWSLVLTLAFCIAWLDAFTAPNPALPPRAARRLPVLLAGLALGLLALTRPWTALAVALPFGVHGLYLLVKGNRAVRLRLLGVALLAGLLALLHLGWQYAASGSPLTNLYTLWWPYDRVGFGPGHGLHPGGFQPDRAWINTLFSLYAANSDLFGWPLYSWIFMPLGLLALRKNGRAWLVCAVLPALVAAYALYWMPSWLFGPRYYYEALFAPLLLTAAGIRWLATGWPRALAGQSWRKSPWLRRARFALAALLAGLLVGANLAFYLPQRLGGMVGLYGVSARCLAPFQNNQARQAVPALVFVHLEQSWAEYGCLQGLNNPFLDSDFVIAISRGPEIDAAVARAFHGRAVRHYYADSVRLLEAPRPDATGSGAVPGPQ